MARSKETDGPPVITRSGAAGPLPVYDVTRGADGRPVLTMARMSRPLDKKVFNLAGSNINPAADEIANQRLGTQRDSARQRALAQRGASLS